MYVFIHVFSYLGLPLCRNDVEEIWEEKLGGEMKNLSFQSVRMHGIIKGKISKSCLYIINYRTGLSNK